MERRQEGGFRLFFIGLEGFGLALEMLQIQLEGT
jgi:hypothetical protein